MNFKEKMHFFANKMRARLHIWKTFCIFAHFLDTWI